MKTKSRRTLLYWFPILLPVFTGILVVSTNGLVEGISHVSRQGTGKAPVVEFKNADNVSENGYKRLHIRILNESPTATKEMHSNIEMSVEGKSPGETNGKSWDSRDHEGRTMISPSNNGTNLKGDKGKEIIIYQPENRTDEISTLSSVRAKIWQEINEAIVIGIFAVYCHFVSILIPALGGYEDSRRTQTAYLWGLIGLVFHLPFVFAIPSFHNMFRFAEHVDYLWWSTVVALGSFVFLVVIHEVVWSKLGRE